MAGQNEKVVNGGRTMTGLAVETLPKEVARRQIRCALIAELSAWYSSGKGLDSVEQVASDVADTIVNNFEVLPKCP
jgi:hypothetical protein